MSDDIPANVDELQSLKAAGLEVQNKEDDVRGRKVHDSDGEHIGHVDDLIVDTAERKVRFLRVAQGGFLGIGEKHYLVPVDAVTNVTSDVVTLGSKHDQVSRAPDYDPELASKDRQKYWGGVYDYWGYSPFWSRDYVYPGYPLYGDGLGRPGVPLDRPDIPRD